MSATYNVVLHIDVLKVSVFDLSLIKWIYTEAQTGRGRLDTHWQVELIHNFSYAPNFFIRVFVLSIAFWTASIAGGGRRVRSGKVYIFYAGERSKTILTQVEALHTRKAHRRAGSTLVLLRPPSAPFFSDSCNLFLCRSVALLIFPFCSSTALLLNNCVALLLFCSIAQVFCCSAVPLLCCCSDPMLCCFVALPLCYAFPWLASSSFVCMFVCSVAPYPVALFPYWYIARLLSISIGLLLCSTVAWLLCWSVLHLLLPLIALK